MPHYAHQGLLYAYGPYAREIDVWADLFDQVIIAAPGRHEPPPGDCLPFTRPNISLACQSELGGVGMGPKLRSVLKLPGAMLRLAATMRRADAVHVRCPGNMGMLGALVAPLCTKHMVAKYAGQWCGYSGEGWTVRLQRRILASGWFKGPVTVYGEWPDQPPHVIPFFTSVMDEYQMRRALCAAESKRLERPARILYVGRLSSAKNVDVLLRALALVHPRDSGWLATIVGDGPEATSLRNLCVSLGLNDRVVFTGALPHSSVMEEYRRSHFLMLPSTTEGWPKALTEAMAHGLACIASDVGLVPWMLAEGRGAVAPVGDAQALADRLLGFLSDPDTYQRTSRAASQWASRFTLEGLRDAIRELLERSWDVRLRCSGGQSQADVAPENQTTT